MPTTVRLLAIDARPFGRDRAGLASSIAKVAPDVACVHGSPHLLRWRSTSAAVARRSGMVVVTGGRPAGANLLLSTLSVDVSAVRDVGFGAGTGTGLGAALAPPGAALAALRLRETEFTVAAVTLAGNAPERVRQVRDLHGAVQRLVPADLPAVICAEGADRPGSDAWQELVANRVGVAGTVFVDGRINVLDVEQVDPATPAAVILTLEV